MISVGRIIKAAGKLAFMDEGFQKIAESTLKNSAKTTNWKNIHNQNWSGIHKQIGNAFKEAERQTCNDSFWKNLWKKNICGFPKDISNAWKNSSGIWGVTKGIGGQVLKRLPILFAALELPNIFSATKDEGIISGLKETVRSATRLVSSMAGFIVGQALIPIPILGGLIGAIGTDLLVDKGLNFILGKSYAERKAEAEEAKNTAQQQYMDQQQQLQQMQQNNPYMNTYDDQNQLATNNYMNMKPTMTPQEIMAMKGMLYGGGMTNPMDQDFMAMTSGINRLNYMC